MTTIYLFNAILYKTETQPGTIERAEEIVRKAGVILDCQKTFWQNRIKSLFWQYVNDDTLDPVKLANSKKEGLFWKFHKLVFANMCLAFISD